MHLTIIEKPKRLFEGLADAIKKDDKDKIEDLLEELWRYHGVKG